MKQILEKIDLDYWCNSKRDIVFLIFDKGPIQSISELSRRIKKSYSVTYKHLISLQENAIIKMERGEEVQIKISLRSSGPLEKIFLHK